ncbi:MAG: fumarylacetoacetate hydrolase family protein [Candidatus Ranarchaeia archaeon]
MKILRYGLPEEEAIGILTSVDGHNKIIDVAKVDPNIPQDICEILAGNYLQVLYKIFDSSRSLDETCLVSSDKTRIGPPIKRPSKIIAVGLNYRDHAEEQQHKAPDTPILFSKAATSITGPFDCIVVPPICAQADYEVELAVVIGKKAKNVLAKNALDYVAGYMTLNDVSGRDAQFSDKQWYRGKSYDTFCPIGPYLVTTEEIKDPHNLELWTIVNGEERQRSNTCNLIFNVNELIEFITQGITLLPGDIIATGTPAGVGVFRDPPIFLKRGDIVEAGIEHLGAQRVIVR